MNGVVGIGGNQAAPEAGHWSEQGFPLELTVTSEDVLGLQAQNGGH